MASGLFETMAARLDREMTSRVRALANRISRRDLLARLGTLLVGASAFPLLPMSRDVHAADLPELGDPRSCDYWRYCAFGGYLCSCCGGTQTTCPPGTEPSPVTWVGTCLNPTDGKQYLISYNDCCGKTGCGRCFCHRTEGDKPIYFPSKSNDILWCFGTKSHSYHCTVALVIGNAS